MASRAFLGAASVTLLLIVWHLLSLMFDSPVLPAPLEVGKTLLATPIILEHTLASLGRVLSALALATAVALPLGTFLGRISWARRLFTPAVYLLYPLPKIALLPLLFLLLGVGEGSRVFLVWLVLFFQVLVAVRDAAAAVPEGYRRTITLLGGGRGGYLRYVLLPATLPSLLTALRIGSGTALAVLFFAETFFTNRGLGFFIVDSWMKASYVDMSAGILTIGILGFLIFVLLDAAQRVVSRWR